MGTANDRLGKDDFERLDELVEGLRQACAQDELGQVIHYDMALHRFLIEASGVEELLTIWLPIVSRMMLHYGRHRNMMESHLEHAAIVQALKQRDLEAATATLIANIQ